jgi:predicted nucleic acid-binding protein
LIDGLLAATAMQQNLTLVTRLAAGRLARVQP